MKYNKYLLFSLLVFMGILLTTNNKTPIKIQEPTILLTKTDDQNTLEPKEIKNDLEEIADFVKERQLTDEKLTIKEKFILAAETYQIDFYLLYGIAVLETGGFTSDLFTIYNNPGDVVSDDATVYAKYESLASTVYSVKFLNGNGEIIKISIL